jgi:hypothetical protein
LIFYFLSSKLFEALGPRDKNARPLFDRRRVFSME